MDEHWPRAAWTHRADDLVPLRLALPLSGRILEVTSTDIMLGRHSQADIRLSLPNVSRRHCRLVLCEGRWHVFDLDSLNGVFVNGERVRQAVLRHRDMLQIGGYAFEVDLLAGTETVQLPIAEILSASNIQEDILDVLPCFPPARDQIRRKAS